MGGKGDNKEFFLKNNKGPVSEGKYQWVKECNSWDSSSTSDCPNELFLSFGSMTLWKRKKAEYATANTLVRTSNFLIEIPTVP